MTERPIELKDALHARRAPRVFTSAAWRRRGGLSAVQACYEQQLKRNPSLKGKIVVRFTIGSTGRITEVDIDDNQMGNDEVASCIKAKIRAWTTPFKPDGDATVSYPFVFQPAS